MATERLKRRIDRLLDEAEEALSGLNWDVVRVRAQAVLSLDENNADAIALLEAADRGPAVTDTSSPSKNILRSTTPSH